MSDSPKWYNNMEKFTLNGQDKKDLNVILERMEQADKDRIAIHDDIKFIKENLFNPHEGLWQETKQNSQFRQDTKKWRGVIGAGFVGLFFKQVYDLFV
ncbi:MAG: hypothetical protein VX868_03870 [Chloroflexota bacterium]|nr:hypothetical protein [Chloroflexota bacterium]